MSPPTHGSRALLLAEFAGPATEADLAARFQPATVLVMSDRSGLGLEERAARRWKCG